MSHANRPFTVAACYKKLWLDKAVQVAYQRMIAFLQIIIIAISALPIDDWVQRIAPYSRRPCLPANTSGWPSTRALGYYKRLNDVRTDEIQNRFKKDLGIIRAQPSKAIKAVSSAPAMGEALCAGWLTHPSSLTAAVHEDPRLLLPNAGGPHPRRSFSEVANQVRVA